MRLFGHLRVGKSLSLRERNSRLRVRRKRRKSGIVELLEAIEERFPRLVLKPWFPFVLMEMLAEEIGKKAPKLLTKTFGPIEKKTVTLYERLVESFNPGSLTEALIISPTADFGITLIRDGEVVLNKPFTELQNPTQYMTKIEARQITENGVYLNKYLLHISEFNWTKEGMVVVTCPRPVTFDYLFAMYKERTV